MKKNFMKAMLLALVVAGMGMFNSCKDTDEDLYNDLRLVMQDKNASLEEVLRAQATTLEELAAKLAAIKQCECDSKGYVTRDEVLAMIGEKGLTAAEVQQMIAQATNGLATQEGLTNAINILNEAIEAAKAQAKADNETLSATINAANQAAADAAAAAAAAQSTSTKNAAAIADVVKDLDSTTVAWGIQLKQVNQSASKALAMAQADSARVDNMEKSYKELAAKADSVDAALGHSLDSLAAEMSNFATKQALQDVLSVAGALYDEAMAYTKQVETAHAQRLGDLENSYATLEGRLGELETKVDEVKAQVEKNTNAIAALNNYLNNLITGIIVQGTQNPVFGSFSLPIGIRSNMLIAYYGETENNIYFPTTRTANFVRKSQALTEKDAEMLGASVESYQVHAGSTLLDNAEGNAGRIFLTINPNTVNFEGTTLPLVNSRDEVSGVKLGALKYSDEKLTFGITRAANNGFYEATATVTEENLESVKLKKDVMNNLKAIAKDVLTPREIDFTNVASRLYNMFDGMLDANGVKATWTENGNEHSVYSQYGIAATAVKPLSYAFLYDTNLGDQINNKIPELPHINPITEGILNDLIDLDKINVELNLDLSGLNFTIPEITPNIPEINIQFDHITIDDLGTIQVKVDMPVYDIVEDGEGGYTIEQTGTTPETFDAETDAIREKIEQAINDAMAQAGESMGEEIRVQLESALTEQLNSAMAEIEASVNDLIQNQLAATINGQLNDAVADVLDQVMSQVTAGAGNYIDKANDYINKVNAWSNKFNTLVDHVTDHINDINSKLQVTVLYKGGDDQFHQLSTSRALPTVFTGAGGASLYLTSCSAELLAPAAKKFIGITNVFGKDGKSAQGGDADCKAKLDDVNNAVADGFKFVNTVLPGNRYGIYMQNLKPGYTYEVYYSAVDFQGKISARKFYVAVK